jgi:LuxR family maltose regulon positive regulatory protein
VLNLLWAEILLEWDRLEEAEVQLREGLRLMRDWPALQVGCLGQSLLARLQVAQGDLPGARVSLAQAEALQQNNHFHPEFISILERAQVRVWTAEMNRPALEAFVRKAAEPLVPELRFREEARRIEVCRALLALDRKAEAAERLEVLLSSSGDRSGSRIAILALLAAALADSPPRAEAALDEALRLAVPQGYLRTFVESGAPLRQTLRAWLQQAPQDADAAVRAYAQQVLLAFERRAGIIPPASSAHTLPERLSQREQEVLRLVAQGLTNQQIAARLVISVRTVKKHVENIHGKLGVQNRTQAAASARALGLLDR